jgi:hypothetical protein
MYTELVVLLAVLLRDAPTALHSLLCMQEKSIQSVTVLDLQYVQ